MLACGRIGLRLRVRPNAFGNALGSSLASANSNEFFAEEHAAHSWPAWLQNWQANNPGGSVSTDTDTAKVKTPISYEELVKRTGIQFLPEGSVLTPESIR